MTLTPVVVKTSTYSKMLISSNCGGYVYTQIYDVTLRDSMRKLATINLLTYYLWSP